MSRKPYLILFAGHCAILSLGYGGQTPVPSTGQYRLNQTVSSDQEYPAVASRPGGFIGVWLESSGNDVKASLFDTSGNVSVGEFTALFTALNPMVSSAPDGSFVITTTDTDSDEVGTYYRTFAPDGSPGAIGIVNTSTFGRQENARVGMFPDGSFAVAWEGEDGSSDGVFLRYFEADGDPITGELLVNTTIALSQRTPDVAVSADGQTVVVVWEGAVQNGNVSEIFGRVYNGAGTPLSGELPINSSLPGTQSLPRIAADTTGNFVVVWESFGQDGDQGGIYAQRFSPDGTMRGPEFRVNSTVAGNQSRPCVAIVGDGSFVIAWDGPDDDSTGIFLQRFDTTGTAKRGVERLVNASTASTQLESAIAAGPGRSVFLAWSDVSVDLNEGYDCMGRTFNLPPRNSSKGRPVVKVSGGNRLLATRGRAFIKGIAFDNGAVASVEMKPSGGGFRKSGVKGRESWRAKVRLQKGRNVLFFRAVDDERISSKLHRITIMRRR